MIDIEVIIQLACEAGQIGKSIQDSGTFSVSNKSDGSLVTSADSAMNEVLIPALNSFYPVLSEESEPPTSEQLGICFWAVDPLDGTKSFVRLSDQWAVQIALIKNGVPFAGVVHLPQLQQTYYTDGINGTWKRDHASGENRKLVVAPYEGRRIRIVCSNSRGNLDDLVVPAEYELEIHRWSSGLKLCLIAEGIVDCYPQLGETSVWDIAAPHAVLRNAGGEVLNLRTREPLTYDPSALMNPPFIASRMELLDVVKPRIDAA
jgi:3'(2'), 5'-bisphosphate nucleotidase